MKAGFFITGTDTDVGKTWTTLALMRCLQRQALSVAGMKPVASGCVWQEGGLRNPDALLIQQLASCWLDYDRVNPYAFERMVSPHIACGDVDVELSVIQQTMAQVELQCDVLLVEGAGGWYSPLSRRLDNAGLAVAIGLPVILVVAIKLGCINHARLTVSAILQTGLPLAGWVAVQVDQGMLAFEENIAFLRQSIDAPLLAVLPHLLEADFEKLSMKFDLQNLQIFDLHQKF